MKLADAVKRASLFAAPPKQRGITTNLRFLPPGGGVQVARIYATDGITGCVVELDPGVEVPNAVLNAKACVDGFAAIDDAVITDNGDPGWLWLHQRGTDCDRGYKVGRYNVADFPGLPEEPAFWASVRHIGTLGRLKHAASTDPATPELRYVNFRAGCVEATDSTRIARVFLTITHRGLVHSGVLTQWPDIDEGLISVTEKAAHFKLDAEWRFTSVYRATDVRAYPDLAMATDNYDDLEAPLVTVVPARNLLDAIRKSSKRSPQKAVRLEFQEAQIKVTGVVHDARAEDVIGHEHVIPALCSDRDDVLVKAEPLTDFLAQVKTPNILLSTFQSASKPIVVRSGNLVEHIWPLVVGV